MTVRVVAEPDLAPLADVVVIVTRDQVLELHQDDDVIAIDAERAGELLAAIAHEIEMGRKR